MQSPATAASYTDFNEIAALRAKSRSEPRAALQQVAKQFEGIFIQMMLKSMRAASFGDPIFDSNQSEFYRDMLDQQVALDMADKKGIGLAEAMVRQLERNLPATAENQQQGGNILPPGTVVPRNGSYTKQIPGTFATSAGLASEPTHFSSQQEFVKHMMPYATDAADQLGVSPLVLIAQAALETGWGNAVLQQANGKSSYNLFNIKAGNDWQGKTVSKNSLEFHNGVAKPERSAFRVYDSYADSFNDYVDFLKTRGRYATALQHDGDADVFIRGLHQAGYATDPAYADKVLNIMQREALQSEAQLPEGIVDATV